MRCRKARSRLDLAALKQALESYRRGDITEGDKARAGIADETARALTEWVAIRSTPHIGFDRIAGFLREEASWPAGALIRRRAEEALLFQRKPNAVVRAYFATQRPITSAGKFALALAFQADGLDRDAAALIRETWRKDGFGKEFEAKVLEKFPGVLTQADHRFRMERQLFKENWGAAQRAAARAGADYASLVKARIGASDNAKKTGALLDAVPAALRSDSSYAFSRAQWLRRNNKPAEAATAIAEVTRDPALLADGDEWWTERRIIARKLLDNGDARAAYEVVSRHGAETAQHKHRGRVPRRLDRAALPRRAGARGDASARRGAGRRDADLARPRRLLARADRRGGRGRGGGAAPLRARRRLSDHLLRPARAGKARQRACPARCARSRRGRPRLLRRDSRRRGRCACSTASACPTSRWR